MASTDPTPVRAGLPNAMPRLHHIGIQTNDINNSVAWYQDFFGCQRMWSLDRFSELTRSRLPGIEQIVELALGPLRFHLFGRAGRPADPDDSATQFQHVCLSVDSAEELSAIRRRWLDLHRSGRYEFTVDVEPTDIVVDSDGMHSCYVYDVNGLEFEFTYAGE